MKFGSWTYDQAQVDVVNRSHMIDMSNYVTNGEWALKGAMIVRNEVSTSNCLAIKISDKLGSL